MKKLAYKDKVRNWLLLLQPGIAIVDATGILLIFIFISALWWDTSATGGPGFRRAWPGMLLQAIENRGLPPPPAQIHVA